MSHRTFFPHLTFESGVLKDAAAAQTLAAAAASVAASAADATTWVQCEACAKWRRLPADFEGELPEEWLCAMHPTIRSCDVPEETAEADTPPLTPP